VHLPAGTPPPTTGPPRIGSLFSGVGGLDAGVQAVFGGSIAWHSEVDPAASTVLAAHYPGIPNHGDITAIDWDAVEPVDILCGGFPCQDVSIAGAKRGLAEGTRSGLWSHFALAIDRLQPKLVVIENVRGLLSTKAIQPTEETDGTDSDMEQPKGPVGEGKSRRPVLTAFGAVLGSLADSGYDACWRVVAASDVGAPHHRARIFILAWRRDVAPDAYLKESRRRGVAVEEEVAGTDGGVLPLPSSGRAGLLPTPVTTDARSAARHTTSTGVMHPGSTLTDAVRSLAAQSVDPALMFATPTAADGKRGPDYARAGRAGSGADDLVTMAARISNTGLFAKYTPVVRRWEELTGQPVPVPTEPSRNGKPRLNPAFSEWLLGWPAGWVTGVEGLNRTAQLTCIGNGVVPQQAAFALRTLVEDMAGATK
jgi:DNA (cytosine-5)-methyltransferase 1